MEPTFVTIPAFSVVGMKYRGNNENNEIAQLWPKMLARVSEIKNIVDRNVSYGVQGNFNKESGEFDYLAGYQVESYDELPEGFDVWNVTEQTYAIFPCILPTLMDTFEYIYKKWLPNSSYSEGDGPEFELYGKEFFPDDPESPMFIYIPVVMN